MTTTELHKILDDDNKKLTLAELKQVIYELKQDCFNELPKCEDSIAETRWYQGEQNAFQIALDLLEHLDHFIFPCKPNDTVYCVTEVDDADNIFFTIMNGVVDCFNIESGCKEVLVRYDSGLTYWHNFLDFGKEVFTDKIDAERKLKELKDK